MTSLAGPSASCWSRDELSENDARFDVSTSQLGKPLRSTGAQGPTPGELTELVLILICELLAIRSGRGRCIGSRRCRSLTRDYEFVRLSIDLKLHFILVESELDRCV